MFYLMDISLSYYAQPLQQLLPDQDFWMTAHVKDYQMAANEQKPAD